MAGNVPTTTCLFISKLGIIELNQIMCFRWKLNGDCSGNNNLKNGSDDDVIPDIQKLFAKMEYSPRSTVDPTDFITKLGVNEQVQQDAQEFSDLFIGMEISEIGKCEE